MSLEINVTDQIVEINETSTPVEIGVSAGAAIPPVWGAITGTLSNQTDLQLVLDGKVPYTGAIANVNLGTYNLTASSLIVNTSGQATTFTNFYPATTDGRNIFIGGGGLNSVRVGRADDASENTAVGVNALLANTSGRDNTAIGHNSMTLTTTGQFNAAVGDSSLLANTTGIRNSAFGQSALSSNTTGGSNVAIGNLAGSGGLGNTTGSNNIFIGASSVGISQTDSNRTFIGNTATTSTWLGGKLLLGSRVDASSDILQATGTASVTSNMLVGQLTLNTTPSGTAVVGTTRWNDTIGSSETTLKGGSVVLKNGVDLVARVVNKVSPNTTLTKAAYQAVRVSGAQGQRLAIELAQANNDNNSADTIGLVTETIAPNQEGFIITVGQLENVNTTGALQGETWADGDVLYLSPTTAGRLTNVKPVAPNHIVVIGYVEYAHANNGKIYVKVMNAWELGELHDVDTTGATNGQVLKYNGTIWTPSADSGITGTGSAGQVAFFTGATTQASSSNFAWDNTNSRLSIGAITPTVGLNVANGVNLYTSGGNPNQHYLELISNTGTDGYVNFRRSGGANGVMAYHLSNGTARFSYNAATGDSIIGSYNASPLLFFTNSTERARIFGTGNFGIGTGATDSGQRLQVTGDTLLRGSGNTSATTALNVQDSAGSSILRARGDGAILIGASASAPIIQAFEGITGPRSLRISLQAAGSLLPIPSFNINQSDNFTYTSGTGEFTTITANFLPTSGTGTLAGLVLRNTINQTGGANGITRGLFVQPALTAAADWRSIEWSNNSGWGLRGEGTAPNLLNGVLAIGTTSPSRGLRIGINPTAADTASNFVNVAVQNTVTTVYRAFASSIGVFSSGFTLPNLSHFEAIQDGTFTAGVVTNHYGFRATNSLSDGTNVFGFWGGLAAATGRWNFYASGTALNYMNGPLLLGSTTNGGERLQVTGTARITGATSIGGNFTIPTGSYDLPALSFANDTNTGLFSSLEDTLEIKTGAHNAVILENAATNLMISSESFGGLTAQNIGVGLPSPTVAAPDGTLNASIAVPNTTSIQHRFARSVNISEPNTHSIYAKAAGYNFISIGEGGGVAGATIIFDLVNGTISGTAGGFSATIENVGNGWYRCSLTRTNISAGLNLTRWIIVRNANSTADYAGDGTSGVYVWGWQMETGLASTSYITTGASAVTRPQAVSILGSNLYGNLITKKITAPSFNDFSISLDGSDRMIIKATTGNIGIGNDPTAALDIKASTTSAAAMRLRTGTAPTTPNDGDIWFDGTNIRMRIGGVTKTFTLV